MMRDGSALLRLAHAAIESDTREAFELALRRVVMLERIVGANHTAAIDTIRNDHDGFAAAADAEFEQLPEDKRAAVTTSVKRTVAGAVRESVLALATASTMLGLDADIEDLNPDHVALTAAVIHLARLNGNEELGGR